ncbi:MAG: hypothetical protein ACYT04_41315 [Nostoc sp.]
MVLKDQRSRLIIAHWLTIGWCVTFNIRTSQEQAIARTFSHSTIVAIANASYKIRRSHFVI